MQHNTKDLPRVPVAKHVSNMTSRDFQKDNAARIENNASYIAGNEFLKEFCSLITQNGHLLRGRTVLNLKCGIGLLALLAAKAGASCVYAVDISHATDYAVEIVKRNGYADTVKVIRGRVGEINLPTKVDVIISDWMGFSLLYLSCADDIIIARDKWLKPGGWIWPDRAHLMVVGIENNLQRSHHIDYWYDIYGFNMKCIRKAALAEPLIARIAPEQVLTTEWRIKTLDLNKDSLNDLMFNAKFILKVNKSGHLDGLSTYFLVEFSTLHVPKMINTGPEGLSTIWLHTNYIFDSPMTVNACEYYYGGIEMFSPRGILDLKNMRFGVELLMPHVQSTIILQRWILKDSYRVRKSQVDNDSPYSDFDLNIVTDSKTQSNGQSSEASKAASIEKPKETDQIDAKQEEPNNNNKYVKGSLEKSVRRGKSSQFGIARAKTHNGVDRPSLLGTPESVENIRLLDREENVVETMQKLTLAAEDGATQKLPKIYQRHNGKGRGRKLDIPIHFNYSEGKNPIKFDDETIPERKHAGRHYFKRQRQLQPQSQPPPQSFHNEIGKKKTKDDQDNIIKPKHKPRKWTKKAKMNQQKTTEGPTANNAGEMTTEFKNGGQGSKTLRAP